MAKEVQANEVAAKEGAAPQENGSQMEEIVLTSEEGLTLEKFEEASEVVKKVTLETKLLRVWPMLRRHTVRRPLSSCLPPLR